MRDWIRTEESLPEKGKKVLVWYSEGIGCYDIAAVDENAAWTGLLPGCATPAYWMPLPEPPSGIKDVVSAADIRGEVIDGRLMLDITEDKESVAELMQCYINGEAAVVNDESYFVVDMMNEAIGEKMVSVFYLRRSGSP
jgi:hypothetical protein